MSPQELGKPDISELIVTCKVHFINYLTSAPSSSRERAKQQWCRFFVLDPDLIELAYSNGCGEIRALVAVQLSVLRTNLEFALHNAKFPDRSDISSNPRGPLIPEWIQQLKGTPSEASNGIEATIYRLEEVKGVIRQQLDLYSSLGLDDPKVPEAIDMPEKHNHNAANERGGCYDISTDIPNMIHSSVSESEHGRSTELAINRRSEALPNPTLENRGDSKQHLPRSEASLGLKQKSPDMDNALKLGNNPSILSGTRDPRSCRSYQDTCAEAEGIHQKTMQSGSRPSSSEHPQLATTKSHQPDLYVGVDFGSTHTAVSWNTPKEKYSRTNLISQWPGETWNENNVPTILARDASRGQTRWGFLCKGLAEDEIWKSLNLLLDPKVHKKLLANDERAPQVPGTTDQVHRLVTLYLRQVYNHISRKIPELIKNNLAFSKQLRRKTWDSLAIDFIFSTPTAWQAPVSQCFRGIVSRAGFGEQKFHRVLQGLTEAEAAAVFTCRLERVDDVQKDDVVLSIRAGGGTTDLAFVKATGDTANSLRLDGIHPVAGVGVGSRRIDSEFAKLIEDRIKDHPKAQSELPRDFPIRASQSDGFQIWKRALGSRPWDQSNDKFAIEVAGLEKSYSNQNLGIEQGELSFTGQQLKSCFDTVLKEIKDLIKDTLDNFEASNCSKGIVRHVNYVVLSGGLGSSDYVLKELITFFNGLASKANSCIAGTKVFRSRAYSRTVVAMGLLYDRKTKARELREHIARANYGIIIEEPRSKESVSSEGSPADTTIRWLVKFGETIQVDRPITVDITKRLKKSDKGRWTEKIVWLKGGSSNLPANVEEGRARGVEELHSVGLEEVHKGTKLLSSGARTLWGSSKYDECDFKLMLSVGPSGDCDVEVSGNVIKRSG